MSGFLSLSPLDTRVLRGNRGVLRARPLSWLI
jgi:hypothetical protein